MHLSVLLPRSTVRRSQPLPMQSGLSCPLNETQWTVCGTITGSKNISYLTSPAPDLLYYTSHVLIKLIISAHRTLSAEKLAEGCELMYGETVA